MHITDKEIEEAKKDFEYFHKHVVHEHNDCIRICVEWFDAQKKTKRPQYAAISRIGIRRWCGRYISLSDVEIAALLHPDIIGRYPKYNISIRHILPDPRRLIKLDEAFKHDYNFERIYYERVKRKNEPDYYAYSYSGFEPTIKGINEYMRVREEIINGRKQECK